MFYLNLAIIDNYYNCNQRTDEEWANEASPNLFLGIFYIAISIFFQILYIPGILALGSKNFIKISAYKIMFVLGLIDIFMLFIIGFAAGFLTIKGSVFCMNRYFTYYTGVIAMGGWVSSCAVTTVLAFSRVLDLYDPYICNMFFDGNKTWLVLCLPLAYFLYFISFTNPLLFSSKLYAFALDPFLGISGVDTYNHDYLNYPLITHDFAIVVIISLLYIIFFYILYRKGTTAGEHSLSPTEKSILRQTLLILGAAFIASLITAEEWAKEASPNLLLGIFYIMLGVTFQVLYVPAVFALTNKEFIKLSAYKIMFVLGILDVFVLFFIGILDGYFTITGSVFCMNPYLSYISGVISTGCWVGGGYRTWVWLMIPLGYVIYFVTFTNPLLYTSKAYAQALDPYTGISGVYANDFDYLNKSLMINDIGIGIFLGILYLICFVIIYNRVQVPGNGSDKSLYFDRPGTKTLRINKGNCEIIQWKITAYKYKPHKHHGKKVGKYVAQSDLKAIFNGNGYFRIIIGSNYKINVHDRHGVKCSHGQCA
uniref:G_PROTEIN_RECEP_F1_2 domain-containing protein n=1 Tax=Rhabditophanes sp. KR3021 TaxID=114890 RepID=A0AC35UE78_9BILA